MRKILASFLVLFFVCSLQGQTNDAGFEFRSKIGFLAAHRGVMAHLPQETAKALELTYFIHTNGKKAWHVKYRYPTVGATLFIGSVGNKELLGNYVGLYGFSELPMVKYKNYEMAFRLGCGLGYTNKIYDPLTNPKNVAVSTHFNPMMNFAVKSTYRFKNHSIVLGLDITHFSNGAFKVPNYGINMPYLSLGYAYVFRKALPIVPTEMKFQKRIELSAMGIYSMKEVMPIGGKKYPVYAINIAARRFFNQKAGMEVDLDIISKQAIMAYLPYTQKTQLSIIQVGLYAAYLVPFDKFHFVFGMGTYLRDKYKPEDFLYHRIGCRYQFRNGLMANFSLKTHFARADYFEFGFGYTFKTWKK
jgi:hypothetical protein